MYNVFWSPLLKSSPAVFAIEIIRLIRSIESKQCNCSSGSSHAKLVGRRHIRKRLTLVVEYHATGQISTTESHNGGSS